MLKILKNDEIEIYNVVPIYRGNRIIKFITSISMEDVNKVYDRLKYDVETQRGERKLKQTKDKFVIEKIMNRSNIEEMKYKIINEFFDGGTLFWNVRIRDIDKQKEVINFDPQEGKITIKSHSITLPDSAQRHMAIKELEKYTLSLNQSEYNFPLNICMYTFSEEQSLFSEINGEGTKASKTRSLYLSNSYKNILVKEIVKDSALKDNVEFYQNAVYNKDKCVSFSVLYSSLFDKSTGAYKTLNEDEVKDFKNWMIRFYDYLIEIRPELGRLSAEERKENMKISIATTTHAWNAYAYIAKMLEGDSNWKRKLGRLNSEFKSGLWTGDILSLDNPIWHSTICTQSQTGVWKIVNSKVAYRYALSIISKHVGVI